MSKTYYMHTIDGKPAFWSGDQICYASFFGRPDRLEPSLKNIRKNERRSRKYRNDLGLSDNSRYGYFRFVVPDDE